MKKIYLTFVLLVLVVSYVQSQNVFTGAFDNLVGKTWSAEGQWPNGGLFKQETYFEYGLNGTIVIGKTKSFTDADQTVWGDRNYGIRQFNSETGKIEFHEFDVYGNVTRGRVETDGKNIHYYYDYGGKKLLDSWIYLSDSNYTLRVSEIPDEGDPIVYLEANVTRKP